MEAMLNVKEKKYLENIINEYSEKKINKIDELRLLDKKAKEGAIIFAYVFGSISSLILGTGMAIAMGVILANLMWLGIIIGIIGLFLVSINFFIYKKLIENGKNKYADQILSISKELLNE